MKWINQFQLYLFDFDGLLVNTEELHYLAYQRMCADRGFVMDWDWKRYAGAAMYEAAGLKQAIYEAFPGLLAQEPQWEVLYQEKKQAYAELINRGRVQFMPGVEVFITLLQEANIPRCVVTHSSLEQVNVIREQLPLLNTIPHWITREDYSQPKPHSECYQTAIAKFAQPNSKAIGFEDSPRGLRALLGSGAHAVLVSELFTSQELTSLLNKPFTHISNFVELCGKTELLGSRVS